MDQKADEKEVWRDKLDVKDRPYRGYRNFKEMVLWDEKVFGFTLAYLAIFLFTVWLFWNEITSWRGWVWIFTGLGILVAYLFLIGLNPLSKLSWKRYYVRKKHYKVKRLLERNGLPPDTPEEQLPENIRQEKTIIEGEYNRRLGKF